MRGFANHIRCAAMFALASATSCYDFDGYQKCELEPGQTCSVLQQCGCVTGLSCDYYSATANKTVCTQPGSSPESGLCNDIGDCLPGLTCDQKLCTRPCSDAVQCPGAQSCLPALIGNLDGTWHPSTRSLCQDQCELQAPQTSCREGLTCAPIYLGAQPGYTRCVDVADTPICGDNSPCAPSQYCEPTTRKCMQWCRTASDCSPPTTNCARIPKSDKPFITNDVKFAFVYDTPYGLCQ